MISKHNRRTFLIGLALLGSSVALRGAAKTIAGRSRPAALDRVAATTRALTIVPDRWKIIVGHHSGTAVGNAAIFDRYHRSHGMEHGLAYHFVIGNGSRSGDGEIEIGGRWLKQFAGGHVHDEAVNQVGIGICCVGNFEETQPTPGQLRSFIALVKYLKADVVKTPVRFAVHREINPGRTVCPGRNFPIAAMHARFG